MSGTVLLAGASGYIGSRVATALLERGYRVLCPVRDPGAASLAALRPLADADMLALRRCSLVDSGALQQCLQGERVDAVISCIASRSGGIRDSEAVEYGANAQLLRWALANNVGHFTLLSAICVQKPRLAFQFAKLRFEQALSASGVSHSIVRPTAYFRSLSGQLPRIQDGKPFLVFGSGDLTRCKPIAEADLATFLCNTLEDSALRGVLPVGGPGPALTPLDQAALLSELLAELQVDLSPPGAVTPPPAQQPLRVRHVPPGLLRGAAAALALPGRWSQRLADKAEFARIGHYYATESMLLWDAQRQCYDAEATPEFGSITLRDSYRAQLRGDDRQSAGDHALFS